MNYLLQRRLRFGSFSPAALFANGEAGVWLDPSDTPTMFTDTASMLTPATVGDPVALMLDKSRGLKLGPELVTNGTFDTDSDWTKGAGWTIGSGVASCSGSSSSIVQNFTSVSGAVYLVSFNVSSHVSGVISTTVGANYASQQVVTNITVGQTYNLVVVGGANTTRGVEFYGGVFNGSIDNVSVRELPGNHATQAVLASRPILRQSGGLYYLEFDGVDDFLVTPTITPGADKAQVFAGVRKLGLDGMIAEISPSASTNAGSFWVYALGASDYRFRSRGSLITDANATGYASPSTNIFTGLGSISGDLATLRIDGTQVSQSTADQGTGDYLAYPLYIGARAGTSLFFNGHMHSLVTRFGDNLDAATIGKAETYVAQKTGVTL